MVYYIVPVLFLLAFWCPCITINVSIQYNGGLLPDIILLTQSYQILCLMGYYIASVFSFTTMFDGILHCYCSVFTGLIVSYKSITEKTQTLRIRSTSDPGKGQRSCEMSSYKQHIQLQSQMFRVEFQSRLDLNV